MVDRINAAEALSRENSKNGMEYSFTYINLASAKIEYSFTYINLANAKIEYSFTYINLATA